MHELSTYLSWDANVRWFHWINLLCMLCLGAVGVVLINDSALGVTNDGKVLLKTVHVWIGYAFALNLLWRLVWATIGGPHARWRTFLPGGAGFLTEVRRYVTEFVAGRPPQYIGHNPLGRIAVTLLLLLLVIQGCTGLVLAGTDLFYPPLGSWIASWVVASGGDPATLVPYAPGTYDKLAYASMRAYREPVVSIHEYGFYLLFGLGMVHIVAVVLTERKGGNLVSAMISGRKVLSETPADKKHAD